VAVFWGAPFDATAFSSTFGAGLASVFGATFTSALGTAFNSGFFVSVLPALAFKSGFAAAGFAATFTAPFAAFACVLTACFFVLIKLCLSRSPR
jgi:hypothetical protein